MNEYLEGIKKGDQNAFKAIFELYYTPIFTYLRSFTRDVATAEDLTQATFATLWEKRTVLEIKSSLKSYLYKMAYNNFLQSYRHQTRKDKLIIDLTASAFSEHYIDNENMEAERIKQLNNAIETLSPACKRIIELKRKGVKNTEISDQLNLSIKTVESHVRNAFKVIRKNFKGTHFYTLIFKNRFA
ncbi:RNA polymerase sigma factor [Thalassobellus citreus]|uniref:RNA polymerase sigma factor n=1 Tax=Thalassobellus citreus TaxID=3367752 RepID=UPI00379FFEB3